VIAAERATRAYSNKTATVPNLHRPGDQLLTSIAAKVRAT